MLEQTTWSPWHGCHKCSPGCANCFVYLMDKSYGRDTSVVVKSKGGFDLPIKKDKNGKFKYPSGTNFKTCFTSDFFIEEADEWREDAWRMIKARPDCTFIIATKRVERIKYHLPDDWGDGYDNVTISVDGETQERADYRMPIFRDTPIKHRYIFVSPILEYVDLTPYLKDDKIEKVCVGGESYSGARICDFSWVEQIFIDAKRNGKPFMFHQTGSKFLKDGKIYNVRFGDQYIQAEKAEQYLCEKYKDVAPHDLKDIIQKQR